MLQVVNISIVPLVKMEEFGSGLVQVKQCEGEVMGLVPGSIVTSVANNNNTKFSRCEGCGELILDRFVMRLSESSWHEECLFCSQCHAPLQNSCYYREGKLFCRIDYERYSSDLTCYLQSGHL